MEECASDGRAESWRAATVKRKAWALSRDSRQPSELQDDGAEGRASPREPMEEKAALLEEPGRIPNKITSWLSECRTPLGASLDDQSTTPTKGVVKNGCSFEDDLSLGAEGLEGPAVLRTHCRERSAANHLQPSTAKTEAPCFRALAKDKRGQFLQRGQSMNSTGSGKSSTVSSVSELLDLYEEDPVDVLYNLGFGTEEPHIASKIPSRFFNSSSDARGIDIRVYLEAQLQRMELENPNYALTSRFRQIEVLATVTNAFSSLYSQVSGLPVQTIRSCDLESVEATPLKKSSVLNAARILKKTITKSNLLAPGVENQSPAPAFPDPEKGDSEHGAEQKQPRPSKSSPSLATVTEESHPNPLDPSAARGPAALGEALEPGDDGKAEPEQAEERRRDREPSSQLPNPRVALLLTQTRDSFEMEEVQSNEGEPSLGVCSPGRAGHEQLMRTASQHSDSSGFAEEPMTDGSANYLKVQESSDSCDSENTVTSIAGDVSTPVALRPGACGRLPGEEESLTPTLPLRPEGPKGRPSRTEDWEQVPEDAPQQIPKSAEGEVAGTEPPGSTDELKLIAEPFYIVATQSIAEPSSPKVPGPTVDSNSSTDTGSTVESSSSTEPGPTVDSNSSTDTGSTVESSSSTEPGPTVDSNSSTDTGSTVESSSSTEPGPTVDSNSSTDTGSTVESCSPMTPDTVCDTVDSLITSDRLRVALQWAQLKAPSMSEEQVRARDLRRGRGRFPLRRASSLPTHLLSPSCVVSSIRIHVRPGSTKHCSPSSFSYRYTPDDQEGDQEPEGDQEGEVGEEVRSIAEEEEEERSSTLCSMPQKVGEASGRPLCPLHLPSYLTHSSNSLRSTTPDWPEQLLCEHSRSWSTCSMPNLPLYSAPYTSPNYNAPQSHHYNNPHRAHCSFPYSTNSPCDYHGHTPYIAPHSGHAYPSAPPPQPSRPPSSTEMQLKRVLHDIRGTVQNLTQCSSLRGESASFPATSPGSSMLSLYENTFQELRLMRKNLGVFRTQMMDLELSLMRQQDSVYQHLSQEERQEADQLKRLRSEVRRELQELELQLEDRLLFLDEQLRSSQHTGLYRHPMGLHGGPVPAGLCSAPPVNVCEPVSELLREQFSLKAELGYDGGGASACSSGFTSPVGTGQAWPGAPMHERSIPNTTGVYRTSVFCTPTPPPRPAPYTPHPTLAGGQETANHQLQEEGGGERSSHPLEERGRGAESLHPLEERGRQPADNHYLQQLIKEIKESIVDEIRQEIVNELLVAMSPRRLPVVTKESTL